MHYTWRKTGISNLDYFSGVLQKRGEIVDISSHGGTIFIALSRHSDGLTEALIIRHSWLQPDPSSNYSYSILPESNIAGRHLARHSRLLGCPPRILAQLSPVDHLYLTAAAIRAERWRDACQARIVKRAVKPKPKRGDLVEFSPPIKFADGSMLDQFIYSGGSRFRPAEGDWSCRIPTWQDLDYRILPPQADELSELLG